jgi:prepilin-type N-terminal cleavage/methylation domain-containing protein
MKTRKAFSLMELLITIAVIGILASFIIVNLNEARIKARDAQRKNDLNQIGMAYLSYYAKTGFYSVAGTGWTGGGEGWFNYESPSDNYPLSMANGIRAAGYFSTLPLDPSLLSPNSGVGGGGGSTQRQYMKYNCTKGFAVYAMLEKPTPKDTADYNAAISEGCPSLGASYSMNYAIHFQ